MRIAPKSAQVLFEGTVSHLRNIFSYAISYPFVKNMLCELWRDQSAKRVAVRDYYYFIRIRKIASMVYKPTNGPSTSSQPSDNPSTSSQPSHSLGPSHEPSSSSNPSSLPSSGPIECLADNNCVNKGKWLMCDTGTCVQKPSTEDACSTCRDIIHKHWTSCTYNPSCPSGYEFLRYDNGPCNLGTERKVCVRYSNYYFCPPCSENPLKGTCGDGNKGNGCCDNGGGCSTDGRCGWDSGYYTSIRPSHAQLRGHDSRITIPQNRNFVQEYKLSDFAAVAFIFSPSGAPSALCGRYYNLVFETHCQGQPCLWAYKVTSPHRPRYGTTHNKWNVVGGDIQ